MCRFGGGGELGDLGGHSGFACTRRHPFLDGGRAAIIPRGLIRMVRTYNANRLL